MIKPIIKLFYIESNNEFDVEWWNKRGFFTVIDTIWLFVESIEEIELLEFDIWLTLTLNYD